MSMKFVNVGNGLLLKYTSVVYFSDKVGCINWLMNATYIKLCIIFIVILQTVHIICEALSSKPNLNI